MAELAALGLAANIVQFLELGARLFSHAWGISRSGNGVSEEYIELAVIAEDIKSSTRKLKRSPTAVRRNQLSDEEKTLYELSRLSREVGDELLRILDDLKSKDLYNQKWKSFKHALKQVRKKKEIDNLEKRLARLQGQISSHLITTLTDQQSMILSSITQLVDVNTRLESNTTDKLDRLRSDLLDDLTADRALGKYDATRMFGVGEKLEDLSREGRSAQRQQAIISSLKFPSMRRRHVAIKKEHEETFEWIFKDVEVGFLPWLKSENGIYWVQGKAGSGKSTLMKYIMGSKSTRTALESWANGKELFIGSYFFWTGGDPMQRSQKGLLRTLLFQIMRQCPGLIERICPERWNEGSDHIFSPWVHEELVASFRLLAEEDLSDKRFCLFVDGLDEFRGDRGGVDGSDLSRDHSGSHRSLVELLQSMARSPSIKICVSSRPWNVFVRAFEGKVPGLKLEDLTRGDIRKYAHDKLGAESTSSDWTDEFRAEIVEEITRRASGVFLWVHLVIDSLLRGYDEGDREGDVRRRLDSLPNTLEDFFRSILSSIEEMYREEALRFFQVAIQAEQALPALAFHYVEQEQEQGSENYALHTKISPVSDSDVQKISQEMKKRINARCRDLLEFKSYPDEVSFLKYQVDFLHRTVRDFFLQTTAMEEILKRETTPHFNPLISLIKAMVVLLKRVPGSASVQEVAIMMLSLVKQVMKYALKIEAQNVDRGQPNQELREEFRLLDEVDHVNSHHTSGEHSNVHLIPPLGSPAEFLHIAVHTGLVWYVRYKVDGHPELLQPPRGRLCLQYALQAVELEIVTEFPYQISRRMEMLRFLLEEKPQDPNQTAGGRGTVWSEFLSPFSTRIGPQTVNVARCPTTPPGGVLRKSRRGLRVMHFAQYYSRELLRDVVKLLLTHGADPQVLCEGETSQLPAIELLEKLLPQDIDCLRNIITLRARLAPDVVRRQDRSPIRSLFRRITRKK